MKVVVLSRQYWVCVTEYRVTKHFDKYGKKDKFSIILHDHMTIIVDVYLANYVTC